MEHQFSQNNGGYIPPSIALIYFPWQSQAPYNFLADMVEILSPISEKIILMGGNTSRINLHHENVAVEDIGIGLHYVHEINPKPLSITLWLLKCVLAQIKTSLMLIRARNQFEISVFYMAYPYFLLPLITSKILKKKSLEVVTRSRSKSSYAKFITLYDMFLLLFLDGISPESERLVKTAGLDKYNIKILPAGKRFIDFSRYTIIIPYNERNSTIGYIGRFTESKGIIELIKAIQILAEKKTNIHFVLYGEGNLIQVVTSECEKLQNNGNVSFSIHRWVSNHEIPHILNDLKFLVLPSTQEGLPTIILEAMACGTPVLSTPVGAIPELIKDGETGFLMDDNSPECIAYNIERAMNFDRMDSLIVNARDFIQKQFDLDQAIERYKLILQALMVHGNEGKVA